MEFSVSYLFSMILSSSSILSDHTFSRVIVSTSPDEVFCHGNKPIDRPPAAVA